MGEIDILTKKYMSNKTRFADIFNYAFYGGRPVIRPGALMEMDPTEQIRLYGKKGRKLSIKRIRDVSKYVSAMQNGEGTVFLLLGIENQAFVHYAAPVRNILYDGINYARQVEAIAEEHEMAEDSPESDDTFLSGIYKTDKLHPVITLVVYWSNKEWDGPLTLHEMLDFQDESLRDYVADYRINLLCPANIDNFYKFSTELGEVLEYIKYSGDGEALERTLASNKKFRSLGRKSAELIKVVTNSELEIPKGKRRIDMCEALRQIKEKVRTETLAEAEAEKCEALRQIKEKVRTETLAEAEAEKDGALAKAEAEKAEALAKAEAEKAEALAKAEAEKAEALAKAAENSTFSTIQKMMKNMKITAEQALAALEIPLSEQPKYLAKL